MVSLGIEFAYETPDYLPALVYGPTKAVGATQCAWFAHDPVLPMKRPRLCCEVWAAKNGRERERIGKRIGCPTGIGDYFYGYAVGGRIGLHSS